MPTPRLSDAVLDQALEYLRMYGNMVQAARALGIPRSTFEGRIREARTRAAQRGEQPAPKRAAAPAETAPAVITPDVVPPPQTEVQLLRERLFELEAQLKSHRANSLTDEWVKTKLIGLRDGIERFEPPTWLVRPIRGEGLPGVPHALWSDWHWGEVVDPSQIGGVNEFNLAIAHERARKLVEKTIYLLTRHVVNPTYPGIVVALGGDMMSGDIHDELTATNEQPLMPALLDLFGVLRWALKAIADQFGAVMVPCVAGNHGRNTRKPRMKERAFTNFDWLLYRFLADSLADDDRIQFYIPDGPDARYAIFGWRHLLTHGDQFKGGDGMIGHFGPVLRGQRKKQSRNAAIGQEFDVMVHGHFHTYFPTQRIIGNGCFPAGALVATPSGVKPIESIVEGDAVISRDGTEQSVTHRFEKRSDAGLVHLKVRGIHSPLTATPNHLIWALKAETKSCGTIGKKWDSLTGGGDRPQWIPADFISPGDYVHIPRSSGGDAPVDEETAWAFGLYIAEGSTLLDAGSRKKVNRICLTMHERELQVLERFARWFDGRYGSKSHVFQRKRQGVTSELAVNPGRDVCADFRRLFGHRAAGKHLPDGALRWRPELAAALIRGWLDGDGHRTKDGVTSGTTISETLAHQLFRLALNAGMRPSLASLAPGGRRKNRSYTIHFTNGQESLEVGGELFYRVHARYRDALVVPVYDLEVSGEHTYVVQHIGVHNSLKGYDEFANMLNLDYEPATQALWLTHPEHGVTMHIPVYLEERANLERDDAWCRMPAAAA